MQDPSKFLTPGCPTIQSVVDLAMSPRPARGIAMAAQARLLDGNLNPYPLPVPLDPNDPSALCSLNGGGWIRDIQSEMNTSNDVQRACTFKLYEFPGVEAFSTLKNLVRFSMQYFSMEDDGPVLINEIPTGTFMFTIPDRTLLDSGNFWDITGHSRVQIFVDLGFENDYVIPIGIDRVQAAKAMLMADMLPPSEGGRPPQNECGGTGGCAGCTEPSGTGTGVGYCLQGYAITDILAQTNPYGMSTVIRQRGADGFSVPILYATGVGMKIEATSGAPIDPFTCTPMPVEIVSPLDTFSMVPGEMVPGEMVVGDVGSSTPPFPAFIVSQDTVAGNHMYLDQSTGKCYDAVTGEEVDPLTGLPATIIFPELFFHLIPDAAGSGGGDGGFAVAQSNGKGYSTSFGWSVGDTGHALTIQSAPGSQYYLHWVPEVGGNVRYLYVAEHSGLKIDAVTGHPIDPWNFQPMPYAASETGTGPHRSWASDVWLTSQLIDHAHVYFLADTMVFSTWDGVQSAGHLSPVVMNWHGTVPTAPDTVFELAGGDGGISTLPVGAIGPQTGGVGAYVWPDPNNPGLTPSCCPTSGPDIPAYRITVNTAPLVVLNPLTGKTLATSNITDDTIPFGPKDNFCKSVNTLLSSANYWPVYDDVNGNFILSPLPYSDGVMPQADPYFKYRTAQDGVILPGITQKLQDTTALANKVVVRSDNTKRASITAVAYNRSARSYISVQNWGRVVQKQPVIQLDTITDLAVLKLRAFIEVNLAALPSESIEMSVMFNPFLEVHDVLDLHVWSPDGKTLEISTDANPFLVTAYTHDYAKRTTRLTLGRLVPV